MIESILRALGLHTGRFTTPHLRSISSGSPSGEPLVDEARFLSTCDEVIPFVELVDASSIVAAKRRSLSSRCW